MNIEESATKLVAQLSVTDSSTESSNHKDEGLFSDKDNESITEANEVLQLSVDENEATAVPEPNGEDFKDEKETNSRNEPELPSSGREPETERDTELSLSESIYEEANADLPSVEIGEETGAATARQLETSSPRAPKDAVNKTLQDHADDKVEDRSYNGTVPENDNSKSSSDANNGRLRRGTKSDDTDTSQSKNLPKREFLKRAVVSNPSGVAPSSLSASSLLQSKQADISSRFGSKDLALQQAIATGIRSIKNTFNEIRSTIDHMPAELVGGPIDWNFWARVVENYNDVVEDEQPRLLDAVAKGIPKEFRGIVWQSVARSKSIAMEELYMHLKTEPSIHEKAIKRDLSRTSFFANVESVDKAGELFNVIKAYSNFDPDVGYTQGMAFIAIPLIMNMTESECFCLLVTLMKEYELRELFCPEMKGLHLLLHQFDRLLEQKLPLLLNHLIRQGIRSLMYASQWFLTFFSYKFPLDVVLRIFDVIITQGTEALIKLAVNLMLRNKTNLLRLNFDALLNFLKLELFNIYVSEDFVQSNAQEPKRFPLLSRRSSSKSTPFYKLDDFMQDSMLVEISPLDLMRYKVEFEQMCTKDEERAIEIEMLKTKSGKLRLEIKGYESELFALNHTHINAVQELVDKKVILPELLSDIDELEHSIASLRSNILGLQSKLNSDKDNIPQDIESQIQELLQENANETERFANLAEKFSKLTAENERLDTAINQLPKTWFWNK